MHRFAAERLITITDKLTVIVHFISRSHEKSGKPSAASQNSTLLQLNKIEKECRKLSLELCVDQIDRIKKELNRVSFEGLGRQLHELQCRLLDETKRTLFMFIPKPKQRFYSLPLNQFGVNIKPARKEIQEAGRCYAAGRNTACVLHLMRVLEVGLNALAIKFGVPFEHTNWDNIITPIEKKIKEIEATPNHLKPPKWKDDRKFYSEVAAQFRFLKDAYRNYAMHVHETYDETDAREIYNHVSSVMRHLATKLSFE